MILLGSVSRKYLLYLLTRKLGPEPGLNVARRRSKTASEIMNTINNFRQLVWELAELGDLFQKEFLYECQCSVNNVQSERNAHRQTHLWKYPTSPVTATRWAGNFDDYLSHNIWIFLSWRKFSGSQLCCGESAANAELRTRACCCMHLNICGRL